MTTTYALPEVPPSGTDRSRFALTTSPTGVSVSAAQNIAVAFGRLVGERIAEATPLEPASREIVLKKVGRTIAGEYVLVDCPPIAVAPDSRPIKTGRHWRTTLRAGSLLDAAFLGEEPYVAAHDDQLYAAARQLAEDEAITGTDLLELNRAVQLLILARAGITSVKPWNLPILTG